MASIIASELVRSTLRLIEVIAKGNTARAEDVNDGLKVLNQMLSSWRNDNLLVYTTALSAINLTGGKAYHFMYLTPAGADIELEPPARITSVNLMPSADQSYNIPIVSIDRYLKEYNKAATADIPDYVAIGYEAGSIRFAFWPHLKSNIAGMIGYWVRLPEFTLNTEIILPDGYEEAMRYNLAPRLAFEYGVVVDPLILQIAKQSLAAIKGLNLKAVEMSDNTMYEGDDIYNIYRGY